MDLFMGPDAKPPGSNETGIHVRDIILWGPMQLIIVDFVSLNFPRPHTRPYTTFSN